MKELSTLTQILREQIKNEYNILKEQYYKKVNFNDDFLDEENDDIYCENVDSENDFENDVCLKLMNSIDKSKYKKIIYLTLLQDNYEYIKSKKIADLKLYKYEIQTLSLLENLTIQQLFDEIENNEDFYLDILTIYLEYQFELNDEVEMKQKNRKLLELTNDKTIKKFKVYMIDDVQFQYTKTRRF